MQHLFCYIYLVVFNTYIPIIVPSAQIYHDTISVHPLVMWYITTTYDSLAPFNYHYILKFPFQTSNISTTEKSVTKNNIIPTKQLQKLLMDIFIL